MPKGALAQGGREAERRGVSLMSTITQPIAADEYVGKGHAARFFGFGDGSREGRLGPKLSHEMSRVPLPPVTSGTIGTRLV
jgi:hypothetical protein